MTTITTTSGRTAALPKDLDLARVAGLDPEGRIVVDDFNARNADPTRKGDEAPFMFGLTLCCNASDKGAEYGVVCRGCYGSDEVGAYLYRADDGTFPGLDPIVGETEDAVLMLAATPKGGPRLHRATCKRIPSAAIPAKHGTAKALQDAMLATCCKPTEAQRAAVLALVTIPAIGTVEQGKGELAGGDVQALPRDRKPRTSKGNRHDQRSPLPPREGIAEVQRALQVVPDTATCSGSCGATLPLQKFPTTPKGRGTECRTCRNARRAAAKA
jgi:hypothetical protein